MIFNPLFLSESGSHQILSPKSGKLSNNKYLFSDIVKVVMNPTDEQKKLTTDTENILGGNVGLLLENSKNPVKLKLQILSDNDNEQAKLGLAEILPEEIAQLLVNDQFEVDEKAISYISKELLNGELQSFVNNLVGEEIIENNISNKSGLLLSLEDSKSAVNLELAKESTNKSANDKIVVQTVVIPEKAKLLSLVDQKIGGKIVDIKSTSLNNTVNQLESSSENVKPTLSVYSFNYGDKNYESLTKNIKSNSGNKHNLSVINNKNTDGLNIETRKVPLEKISFIPSDLKKEQSGKVLSTTSTKLEGTKISDLKLFETKQAKIDKDFSVSKITIVKKNGEVNISDKQLINKNQPLNTDIKLPTAEVESALKRIDFTNVKSKTMENVKLVLPNNKNSLDKSAEIQSVNQKSSNTSPEQLVRDFKIINNTQQNNVKNLDISVKINKNDTELLSTKGKVNGTSEVQSGNPKSVNNSPEQLAKDFKIINKTEQNNIKNLEIPVKNIENDKELLSTKSKVNGTSEVQSANQKSVNTSAEQLAKDFKNINKTEKNLEIPVKSKENDTELLATKNKVNGQVNNLKAADNSNKVIVENKSETNVKNNVDNLTQNQKTGSSTIISEEVDSKKIESNKNISELPKEDNIKNKSEVKMSINDSKTKNTNPIAENKTHVNQQNTDSSTSKNIETLPKGSLDIKETQAKAIDKNDDQTVKTDKSESDSNKNVNTKLHESKNVKNDSPKMSKEVKVEGKVTPENVDNKNTPLPLENNREAKKVVANKKVSVKVKGGIKSISGKTESKSGAISNNTVDKNSTNNSNKNPNNSFSSNKEFAMPNSVYEFKGNPENGFNQAMNKEGVSLSGLAGDRISEVEDHSNRKMVKSAEVIKELTKFISKQEKGSLSFDIRPEQLGKMKIILDTTDHVIKARIEVESEQAKQLIERNIDKLHQELSDNGVKLNSLNISLGYSKQQKEQQEEMKNKQFDSQGFEQAEESEEKEQKKTLGYNTYEYIA